MRKIYWTFLLLFFVKISFAQTNNSFQYSSNPIKPDSSSSVFNGMEHTGYPLAEEGMPYYLTQDWQKGTMVFRDQPYTDIFLKYDLIKDELILRHYNGFTGIILFTPRISSFTLLDKKFVNLPASQGFAGGIYEELSTGSISLYAKRTKLVAENLTAAGIERRISQRNHYLLFKDGVFHQVRNEGDVMDLVKDKKSEVKAHLRGKGIKYRRDREHFLITVLSYYNQLSR